MYIKSLAALERLYNEHSFNLVPTEKYQYFFPSVLPDKCGTVEKVAISLCINEFFIFVKRLNALS